MKKILSLILVCYFALTACMPRAFAVQFYGADTKFSDNTLLPDVVDKSGKNYFTFRKDNNAGSGLSSLVCYRSNSDNDCEAYVATIDTFFIYDRNYQHESEAAFQIGKGSFKIKMYDRQGDTPETKNERYKLFVFHSNNDGNVYNMNIARTINSHKCGTKNDNMCVVGIRLYLYILAIPGSEGVHLSKVYMSKYNDENDNFLFYEKGAQIKNGFDRVWINTQKFLMGQHSYGVFLFGLNDGNDIFSIPDGQNYKLVKFSRNSNGSAYFYDALILKNVGNGMSRVNTHGNVQVLNISTAQIFNELDSSNELIRDFVVGNDTNLNYTLPQFFGSVATISGIVDPNTGEIKQPGEITQCELQDILCHTKNMFKVFTDGVISFLSPALDWIKGGFSWLLDQLKNFFSWLFDQIKNFLFSFFETDFYKNWIKPIVDYISSYFQIIISLLKQEFDFKNFFWGDQAYMCSKNQSFFIEDTTATGKKPVETLGLFFYFMNPLPLPEGSQICTSMGLKTIHYGKSTFIDILLFNIFVFAGIWFLFLFLRKY